MRISRLVPRIRRLLPGIGFLGLCALAACSDAPLEPERDRLADHRALWRAEGPSVYAYEYRAHCFCLPAAVAPVRVHVDADSVVAVTSLETGDELDRSRFGFGHPLTVEGLFDFVEESLSREPASVEVSYDEELGFPAEAFFDFEADVADEELGFSARELTVPMNSRSGDVDVRR